MIIIFLYIDLCDMTKPLSKSDAKLQKNTNMINPSIFKKVTIIVQNGNYVFF